MRRHVQEISEGSPVSSQILSQGTLSALQREFERMEVSEVKDTRKRTRQEFENEDSEPMQRRRVQTRNRGQSSDSDCSN